MDARELRRELRRARARASHLDDRLSADGTLLLWCPAALACIRLGATRLAELKEAGIDAVWARLHQRRVDRLANAE